MWIENSHLISIFIFDENKLVISWLLDNYFNEQSWTYFQHWNLLKYGYNIYLQLDFYFWLVSLSFRGVCRFEVFCPVCLSVSYLCLFLRGFLPSCFNILHLFVLLFFLKERKWMTPLYLILKLFQLDLV